MAGLEQAGYAVSQGRDSRAALLLTLALPPLSLSVPLVPSASCPGRSCSCMRRSSTVGRSCLCARSAGTGHQVGMACRCTSRPSIGGTVLPGAILPRPSSPGPSSLGPSFVTPWTAACQASLSITISWSLLKLMSIESVIPSNHLILYCPLLLLPSLFPSIRVFENVSVLCIRWPK